MGDIHAAIDQLERKQKSELNSILADELGATYEREIPNSLRNDFIRACYARIAPDEDPMDRVRTHPNYSPNWREKKALATALRMLLTERVDHPEFDGITSLTKTVLAELVVAIRDADERPMQQ